MSALQKPELRGHLKRYIVRSLAGATVFTVANCAMFYFFYMQPKKTKYAEFARTYNPEEHLKLLTKYGYIKVK